MRRAASWCQPLHVRSRPRGARTVGASLVPVIESPLVRSASMVNSVDLYKEDESGPGEDRAPESVIPSLLPTPSEFTGFGPSLAPGLPKVQRGGVIWRAEDGGLLDALLPYNWNRDAHGRRPLHRGGGPHRAPRR